LAILSVLVAAVFAGLLGLGTWQLQRRVWKLDLIARVNQRVHAAPVAPPGPGQWATVTADRDAYRHVRLAGEYLNDKETLVQAVTVNGPGFWVLTPLQTPQGYVVLVNRGFVPPERTAPSSRASGQIGGPTTVSGLLRVSEPHGGFLHSNAPSENRWYSRDVAAIAAARGLNNVAPYFVDADATANPGGWPVGGLTVIAFPNSHLIYAITWFTLAAMVAVGGGYAIRQTWLARRSGAGS
jgi:surfeit locus 1 family protein